MTYSLKAKCQGCKALLQDDDTFACSFGLPLIVEGGIGNHHSPQPNEQKCYKPKSMAEWQEAKKLMKAKLQK